MPLYEVSVSYTSMVVADDPREAEQIAEEHAREDLSNGADFSARGAVREPARIPPEWRGSIPWGESEDRTCEEIVAADAAERAERARMDAARAANLDLPFPAAVPRANDDDKEA